MSAAPPPALPDGTPLTSRRVPVGDLTLHVVEAGPPAGRPVILLHGFPESWRGWPGQIGPLARAGFRAIVPDQRGYGGSDKPEAVASYRLSRLAADVVALGDALGLVRFGLVGHDWGGIVAWAVAGAHPERVDRLAIVNAPHPDTRWPVIRADPLQLARSWYAAAFQLPGLPERWLARRDGAALARALKRTSRPGTFSEDDLDGSREAWCRPGAIAAMLAWYRALIRHPPRPVGRIAVPTLILWGRRDVALGPAFATASLAFCDEGRLRWFDEATHWLPHEEPQDVADALVSHLAGADPR